MTAASWRDRIYDSPHRVDVFRICTFECVGQFIKPVCMKLFVEMDDACGMEDYEIKSSILASGTG